MSTKIQYRGHCQRCGRVQAVNGHVANHGYRVADRGSYGYHVGTCAGSSQYRPLELDRGAAGRWIRQALDDAASLRALALALKAGTQVPTTIRTNRYDPKTHKPVCISFAEGNQHQRAEAVRSAIWNTEQKASAAASWAEAHQALADRVFGQPLLVVLVAPPPPPILVGDRRLGFDGSVLQVTCFDRVVYWKDAQGYKGRVTAAAWRALPQAQEVAS